MARLSPVKVATTPRPSKRSLQPNDPRAPKRNRPTPSASSQKENRRHETGAEGRSGMHEAAQGQDEQALLDDLMAGLDASIFEYTPSSPVVSQKAMSQTRPSKQVVSPTKRSPVGLSKLTGWGVEEKKVKREVLSPTKPRGPSVRPLISPKLESKPIDNNEDTKSSLHPLRPAPPAVTVKEEQKDEKEAFEDELFEFDLDLDLADFAALDSDVNTNTEARVRYPILNPTVPPPPAEYAATPWARCKVKAVLRGLRFGDGLVPDPEALSRMDMDDTGPSVMNGKTAVVKLKETGQLRVVHLKDRWADLPLVSGDIVNIISTQLTSASPFPIVVTFKDTASFVIHHPDLMLTMTSISNAMPCPRKPILQSLVKVPGPGSKAMLYGTILHGLLQEALSEQDFAVDSTRRRLDNDLKREERRLDMWGAGLGLEDVRLEVGAKAGKGFETFAQKWVGAKVKDEGDLHTQPGDKPSLLAINGLHDIEEDIWSPKWGLKGKVDASVQALIQRPGDKEAEETVAPLEIKTGRSVGVMAHRAQTMLYTLLMEDRYGIPIPAGLLYYSQLDSVLRVEARPNEIRALIVARNELAHFLAKKRSLDDGAMTVSTLSDTVGEDPDHETKSFLPPTIDNSRECKMCYAVDTCMLYRKTIDAAIPSADDPIVELYEEKTGHLTGKDVNFFKKWESLLTVEEQDMGRFRSQLWTMTSVQREKTGRCFGDMVISSYSNDLGKSLAKIHRHAYTFTRSPQAASPTTVNLLSGHIAKGDPVSISIEPDMICMWRGFVLDLTPHSIIVGVTYVIDTHALLARTAHRGHKMDGDRVVFRIDKDEMTSGIMKMRANLASLFFENGAEALRKLVVDQVEPRFDVTYRPTEEEIPVSFNADQRKAMEAVLTEQDYALILGMPGTGKTTTIAEIIKCLVERGKTVLLTSYTHSAVDTILMKLVNAEFGILRLGNVDKVHPDVQHLTLEAMPSTSMDDLENRLMNPPVVAATCLSVDHPLFFRRRFDYCIVDEASQITLPTCLGPLRLADRFVLVGDHFQLPPIVRNPEAKKGGLDVSLFRTLSEAHPAAVTDLSYQYRMNEDIMTLSNQLIYEGRLKCGSEAVAKRGLKLQRLPCKKSFKTSCDDLDKPCWIQNLMDESIKAVFVDTDQVPATDSRVGDLVQNETEARLVYQLARAMTASGLKESDLAVITPYRQQIKLLSGLFAPMPRVEILTADKSQGRDKECILISLVRSNDGGYIGDLLKDWRRINVSFTRAKSKLVIFGSRKTLEGDQLLKGFMELMSGKGWIYNLPKGADTLHCVEGLKKEEQVGSGTGIGRHRKLSKDGKGKGSVAGLLGSKPFAKDILADLA